MKVPNITTVKQNDLNIQDMNSNMFLLNLYLIDLDYWYIYSYESMKICLCYKINLYTKNFMPSMLTSFTLKDMAAIAAENTQLLFTHWCLLEEREFQQSSFAADRKWQQI